MGIKDSNTNKDHLKRTKNDLLNSSQRVSQETVNKRGFFNKSLNLTRSVKLLNNNQTYQSLLEPLEPILSEDNNNNENENIPGSTEIRRVGKNKSKKSTSVKLIEIENRQDFSYA